MRVREFFTNSREPKASKRKRAISREARAEGSAPRPAGAIPSQASSRRRANEREPLSREARAEGSAPRPAAAIPSRAPSAASPPLEALAERSKNLAAIVACAWLAACSGGAPGAECESSDDCEPGLSCLASICQAPTNPKARIAWRVTPPEGSGLIPAAFPHFPGPQAITFCSQSSVSGTLGFDGRALLVATGELASLPGVEERFEGWVEGAFTFALPPGTWRLTFHPESQLPPIAREVQIARCESRQLPPIESAPESRLARFRLVVDAERDPRSRCGAYVRIHDPRDGAPLSARRELRPGPFCERNEAELLAFRPPAGGDAIEIRIGALDAAVPTLPEQRLRFTLGEGEPVELGLLSATPGGGTLERVVLHLFGASKAPQRNAKVTASLVSFDPDVDAAADEPADGGDDAPLLRFRSPPATEIAPGVYELWLLPGRHAFRAEPPLPASSSVGSCVAPASGHASDCQGETEIVRGRLNELVMALPPKLALRGTVVDFRQRQVEGAEIRAVPARSGGGRPATAVADRSGTYELLLDAGDYDLEVRSPDRLQPWLHRALPEPLVADGSLDFVLPPPAIVTGTIRKGTAGATEPLPDAMVRAYGLEGERGPRLLGETVSRSDGSFLLVLPAD